MTVRKGWPGSLTRLTECQLGVGACVQLGFPRRIRCSHSALTKELVAGDVMRSDYRLVHILPAKGWLIIPQSLKECFVKSGWRRGKKRDGENEEEGGI